MQFPEKINHKDTFGDKGIFLRCVILLCLFLFTSCSALFANADSTGVKKINGKLFIVHKVDVGQGLYGVARRYKTTVPKIKDANPGIAPGLFVGQIILVPYDKPESTPKPERKAHPNVAKEQKEPDKKDADVISQQTDKEPIYHTVTKKETLEKIAKNHHLTIEQLKAWNHSGLETMTPGEKVIVGYKEKKEAKEKTKAAKIDKLKTIKKEDTETIIPEKATENAIKRPVTENGMGTWVDDGSIKTDISLAMHKTAPTGTIIKVTNPMNGKAKYVKVVGSLPDTDDNKSIIIKISKNTADDLGIIDKDFRVKLEYSITDTTSH